MRIAFGSHFPLSLRCWIPLLCSAILFTTKVCSAMIFYMCFLTHFFSEQAWANAFMFTGQRPSIQTIYEQTFHAPVEIGSICEFNSSNNIILPIDDETNVLIPSSLVIVYTTPTTVQVEVETIVVHPETLNRKTTNTFYFTFTFEESIRRQVMPRLYDEAMKVRHFSSYSLLFFFLFLFLIFSPSLGPPSFFFSPSCSRSCSSSCSFLSNVFRHCSISRASGGTKVLS